MRDCTAQEEASNSKPLTSVLVIDKSVAKSHKIEHSRINQSDESPEEAD